MRPMQVDYERCQQLPWRGVGQLWAGRHRDGTPVLIRRFPGAGAGSAPAGLVSEMQALELFDAGPVARVDALVADTDGTAALVLAPPPGTVWAVGSAYGATVGAPVPARAVSAIVDALAMSSAAGVVAGRLEVDAFRPVRLPNGSVLPVVVDLGQVDLGQVGPAGEGRAPDGADLRAAVRDLLELLGRCDDPVARRVDACRSVGELAAVLRAVAHGDEEALAGRRSPAGAGSEPVAGVPLPQVADAGPARGRRATPLQRPSRTAVSAGMAGLAGLAGIAGLLGVTGLGVAGLGAVATVDGRTDCASSPAPPVMSGAGGVRRGDVDGDGCVDTVVWEPLADGAGVVVRLVDGSDAAVLESVIGLRGEVLLGDWDCDGSPTLAVHRSDTGEVVIFDGWVGAATPERVATAGTVLPVGARAVVRSHGGCDVVEDAGAG